MKKIVVLGLAAVLCFATAAFATHIDTATTSGYIVTPIFLDNGEGQGLSFGSVATNSDDTGYVCTVVQTAVDGGGNGTLTASAPCVDYDDGDDSDWTITAASGKPYSITRTGGDTMFNSGSCAGFDDTIEVDTWTADGAITTLNGTGTGTGATQTFAVGATAHLVGNQCPGSYLGSFLLTALYL